MIVYGTKGTQIAKELLVDKCPNCGTQNSVELYIFQKYAHVFWIPFFPIGKTAVSQCGHCKQALKLKEMPPVLQDDYQRMKQQSKTPVWTFSGLALVVLLIVIGVVTSRNNDARNAKLIAAPQTGDVYEVKTPENQYTLYKVASVTGDSVFVRMHQYETNGSSGLTELKNRGDAAYSEEVTAFLKSELKEMLDKGGIVDVDRK